MKRIFVCPICGLECCNDDKFQPLCANGHNEPLGVPMVNAAEAAATEDGMMEAKP